MPFVIPPGVSTRHRLVAALIGAVATLLTPAETTRAQGAAGDSPKLLRVEIAERLDDATVKRLRREITAMLDADPAFRTVIFRWETTRADAAASLEFAEFIFDVLRRRVTAVSWVPTLDAPMGHLIGPVLAAKEIVLGPSATLAALPIRKLEATPEPQFSDEFRSMLEDHARHWTRPTVLAAAFVERDHDAIHRVVFPEGTERRSAWKESGKAVDFLTQRELDNLDRFDRRGESELVCPRGQSLQVPADAAARWKITDRRPADNEQDVLIHLDLVDVAPDDVVDLTEGGARAVSSATGQAVVDFLHHPVVRALLVLGGCLGILLEIKMLGTMIPFATGMVCFLTLFFSSLYPVTGAVVPTATVWEILGFFVGLGLVAVEFLLVPGVAVFALGGGATSLVCLVLSMVPPSGSATDAQMTLEGAITTLIFGFGLGSLGFALLLRSLPKTPSRGFVVQSSIGGVPTANSAIDAQMRSAELIGKVGVADTPLRPSGSILLEDGSALDVVADSSYIERGTRVVVRDASGVRVIVGELRDEPPPAPPSAAEGESPADGDAGKA